MHILASGVRKSHMRARELVYNGSTLSVNILEVLLLTVTEPKVLSPSHLERSALGENVRAFGITVLLIYDSNKVCIISKATTK